MVTFDQFEEIFTLGAGRPESEEFLIQLADLVENYYPASIRERLVRGKTLDFEYDRQPYHILLALREDFVGLLDRLRARMPAVMRARFAVQPFTGEKALEAVEKPGQAVVDSQVARQIVRFTASKRGPGVVDPAILCLLCRELNRGRSPGGKISAGQLEGDSETILSKFWEDSIAALEEPHRQPVREFIEDRLVSPNGFRTAAPRDEVASHGTAIDALVDGRLLRGEERFGTPHLELTHDVLCPVVRKTREERRLRTEQAEIERQREAEKTALERQYEISHLETERRAKAAELELVKAQARRNRMAVVLLLALALVAMGAAGWAFRAQKEDYALRSKEKELRTRAEVSAATAESNSEIATEKEGAAKASEAWAKQSADDADRQREIANQQRHLAQAALSRSSVQDAADLAEAKHAPQAMAHLARSLRIPGESLGARSWFTGLALRNDWWSWVGQFRHQDNVWSAAFSPDGRRVVTASFDQTARVWEADTGKPVGAPLQHQHNVLSAAFSPDGRRVVTASADHTARVWEADTGKPVGAPLQHQAAVLSATFSPDGRRVVTASEDHTARVWEADTGKPVGAPLQHQASVISAAFSPDGRRVVTASGTIRRGCGRPIPASPSARPCNTRQVSFRQRSVRTGGVS